MSKKSRRNRRSRKRSRKSRGGAAALEGAPLSYSLAGNYSSMASMSHGGDFMKYHAQQHGGEAPLSGAFTELDPALRSAAGIQSQDAALAAIKSLTDQNGGRRKNRKSKKSRKSRKAKKSRKSRKGNKKSRKSRKSRKTRGGGSLSGAPYGGPTMLLDSYKNAGLSNWNDIEVDAAKSRQMM